MVATLACESFVLDPRPKYPLLIPVKRYWSPEHYSTGRDALTFVCAHGASFSKEHWEPTIKHLYDHASSQCTPSVKIREFWAVDAPRHGESSAVNDGVDHWEGGKICPWENYARSIHAVLSGMAKGLDVKFHKRRLVGLGHSLGANALLLTNGFMPDYAFSSLILVEPVLLPRPHPAQRGNDFGLFVESSLNKSALRRRDTWRSREEALESCRKAFRRWHPGIIEIFIRHNLRELPTPKYPQSQGVTLSCTREDEAACSYDPVERTRCYKYFGIQCKKQPVHLIFGASSKIAPDYIINDIVTVGSGGKHASLAKVAGAGHLVPQMQPRRLSDAIWVALLQDATGGEEVFRSRL